MKQNEENRDLKQNEQIQNRKNVAENINLGTFLELPTGNKLYVNCSNLHIINNESLLDNKDDNEMIGSLFIGEREIKQILDLELSRVLKPLLILEMFIMIVKMLFLQHGFIK